MMNVAMILGLFPAFMAMVAVYYILKAVGLSEGSMIRVALVLVYSASAGIQFYIAKASLIRFQRVLMKQQSLTEQRNGRYLQELQYL